jgi:hypothetical protein
MSPLLRRIQYNPSRLRRYRRIYGNIKSQNVFIFLMALSAIALLMPIRWTGPVEKLFQAWLAPAGHMTILAAQKAVGTPATSDGVMTDQHLERMLMALSLRLQELELENRSLLGLREGVGPGGSLVPSRVAPAKVVGMDSLGLASVEIDRGTFAGLKEGLPVLAAMPLDILQQANLDPKLAIAAGTLVGRIAYEPGPYTARVELISGPKVTMLAYVVRYVGGRSKVIARVYVQGTPKGDVMRTAQPVPANHGVEVGDFVIPAEPEKLNLPNPVVLGRVSQVDISTDNRHFVNLAIEPFFRKTRLNRVYVLVP